MRIGNKDITLILLLLYSVFSWVRWWRTTKGAPYRKTILLMGICLLVAFIAYYLMRLFPTVPFSFLGLPAFFGFCFFLIKAAIAERKFKKSLYSGNLNDNRFN